MDAFTFLMDTDNPHRYEHAPKKRWRTVCEHDRRARRAKPQPQRSLLTYIRPPTWLAQSPDLGADVVTVIVEALMRTDDWRKARYIKALALVNRLCAAAVASALGQVRARLQHNGRECARATKVDILYRRANDGSAHEHEALSAEAKRLCKIHEAYMEDVGIPKARRMTLAPFADRTWFHDNVSLLGHLSNACELCNGPVPF